MVKVQPYPRPHSNYCRPYTEFDVYAETENDKAAAEGFLGHPYTRVQNMECKSKPREIFYFFLAGVPPQQQGPCGVWF